MSATASAPLVADASMIRASLGEQYGSAGAGFLSLLHFPEPDKPRVNWCPVSDLDGAARFIAALANEGHTPYIGMGLRRERLPNNRRGGFEDVCGISALWGDVDYANPLAHKREDLPQDQDAALAIIRGATPVSPSLIVDSGFGFYPMLLLREFWAFDDDAERERAASLLKRYQLALQIAAGASHVDSTSDLARVLKPPGSINWKVAGDPRLVRIFHEGGPRFTADELEEILPQVSDDHRAIPQPYAGARGPLLSDELDEVVATCQKSHRDGARHHSSLFIAGWCGNAGIEEADTETIVDRLSANDRNPKDRRKSVNGTYARLRAGKPVSGYYGLRDAVGMDEESLTRLELLRDRFHRRTAPKLVRHIVTQDSAPGSNGAHDAPPSDESASTSSRLPIIDTGDRNLSRTTQKAWAALEAANVRPTRFVFGDLPVRIRQDEDDDTATAERLTVERLGFDLARIAIWTRPVKNGVHETYPPVRVLQNMLADPDPPLPSLRGIVQVPVFAPDGSLQLDPGYHPTGRSFYAPVPGFSLPPIPNIPTADDVKCAVRLIVADLLGDFDFIDPAERANAVALLLDRYLRNMVNGPTPFRLIESPMPGSGKGLLADVLLRPSIGRQIHIMPAATNDAEWGKRITAQLCQLPEVILIDNIVDDLDSGAFSAALTADYWTDRRLGVSEMVRVPIRCAWVGTANNATMTTELARRTVRIRLDPKVDQPWRRSGFKHPDLRSWVDEHRAELVFAALVLGRHWIAEGSPLGSTRLGSFEHWSAVLGGVLGCAGIEEFLGNVEAFYEEADIEGAIWRQFVGEWFARFGEREVTSGDLFGVAFSVDGFDLGRGGDRAQRTAFGIALNRRRDRVIDSFRIVQTRTVHRVSRWRLIRGRQEDPGDDR